MRFFFFLTLAATVFAQLPTTKELEAEAFAQEIYRAFGSPGSKQFNDTLGAPYLNMLLEGIREGNFTQQEAAAVLVDILKERGTLPQGAFLPPVVVRGLARTETHLPTVFYEEPYPTVEPPTNGIILSSYPNPLIRVPAAELPAPVSATSGQPSSLPAGREIARQENVTAPAAVQESVGPTVKNYTDQDFLRMVGPIGVVTSGGSRGQRAAEVFSGQQLLDGAREIIRQGGRIPTDNRTSAGIAALQLMLLGAGYDLGEEGLDGLASLTGSTTAMLQRFQREEGIAPDGRLTAATWQALLNRFLRPRTP